MMSTPWLTDDEIDDLCGDLVQNAAKVRRLRKMGLNVTVRPNGRPLVLRSNYMRVMNHDTQAPSVEPEPQFVRPPVVPFEETPLGRWIQRGRDAEAKRQAEIDALPKPTKAEIRAAEREADRRRREARMAIVRFHAARRRIAKLQRTPSWADQEAIRAFYVEAVRLSRETGIAHHVDHVIPLQGALVSGLHVETNLQILQWRENVIKRNRFEIEQ